MTTVLIFILFILAGIYCALAKTREEEAAIREGRVSAEHIEIKRIKRKISLLSIIASDKSLFVPLVDGGLIYLGIFLFLGLPVICLALFSDGWDAETKTLLLSPAVGIVALMLLWGKIQHFCRCQSLYLKNKLQFLEELDAAKRNGCDEASLNAVKQVLEHELQRRNEVVPRLAHIEMIDEYVSRERREGSLSARFAEALRDEASSRIESGEWLPGGKHPAHSRASDAGQRVATDENGKQLTIWDALMGRKSAAAQTEPKQVEADSIRALLGARIKEMEAILERLQAERERLANVASDEELDALATEIRARQKLIHAINQGADDMELHLCIARVEYGEEIRKEFEQMRLSGA